MEQPNFHILLFSKTSDFRHSSISAGTTALTSLATRANFAITVSEDASLFTPSSLSRFATLVFLHTSGEFLTHDQLDALKAYVRSGGGFVGIHCASFGMLSSDWYGKLVGAHFKEHPEPQWGMLKIEDGEHFTAGTWGDMMTITSRANPTPHENDGAVAGEGAGIRWFDEWYNFKSNPRPNVRVLMSVKESSYKGGTMGEDHPIAWYQEFDGGRSFYTALGHFDDAYQDEAFMGQIQRAIFWTAGRESDMDDL